MATTYSEIADFSQLVDEIVFLAKLKKEHGSRTADDYLAKVRTNLKSLEMEAAKLDINTELAKEEPNDLNSIRALRPEGPRRLRFDWDDSLYREKLEGAFLARASGNVLGSIVEGWTIEEMEDWATEIGDTFPPTDYWTAAKTPTAVRYMVSQCKEYTRDGINGVPVDDDIIYTLLGVLTLEECGLEFSSEDIGKMWHKYLPWIYKDMEWPLHRYLSGVPAESAADDSPYNHVICASIRCDPYGYVAPGYPEMAAEFGYRDAHMSHRRNGIYGGMFFSAAIAAAFCVSHPVEALEIGLTEIPRKCQLAQDIRWALRVGKDIHNYREARAATDDHFGETALVTEHVSLNSCLTVFGLMIGGTDVTRVISETVSMGHDNDCTAATAGSIVGAIVGKEGIPSHWYRNFNDKVHSYIRGYRTFPISELVERYRRLARRVLNII